MKTTGAANLASAITGFTAALLAVLVAFGLELSADQQASILALVGALVMLMSVIIAIRGADKSTIVESLTPSGKVLAGEANELKTGSRIRDLGDNPALRSELPTQVDPTFTHDVPEMDSETAIPRHAEVDVPTPDGI